MNGLFFLLRRDKGTSVNKRILKKFPPVLNYIFYSFDFIVKRVLPKLKFTRPLYFFLTHGNNLVISRQKRLAAFQEADSRIRQESFIGNNLCIEAKKICDPLPINENIYGPLIALSRVGRNGELIKVYKLRTMHPYFRIYPGLCLQASRS